MKKKIYLTLTKTACAFRAVLGIALLLPILGYMIWFNYTIDRSGLFQGDRFERETALMLINKQDVFGYEKMDERQISKLIIKNIDEMPSTVALGSSRILQLTSKELGSKDYFNFGMIGGSYNDVISTFYLMETAKKLPKTIIIGFDPWHLKETAVDARSDKPLYAESLHALGEDIELVKEDDSKKWEELFSPSYFQGCVEYFYRDKSTEKHPSPVVGDVLKQVTEIKRGDGSVLYTEEFRNQTQDEITYNAMAQAGTFLYMSDYDEPSNEMLRIYDKFLKNVQSYDISVVFVLSPYQHTLWDIVVNQQAMWPGFFKTEEAVRSLAARHNIPVYGSYNPYAIEGLEPFDFHDGIHVKTSGITKFFPDIRTVLSNIYNSKMPVTPDYKTLGFPAQ